MDSLVLSVDILIYQGFWQILPVGKKYLPTIFSSQPDLFPDQLGPSGWKFIMKRKTEAKFASVDFSRVNSWRVKLWRIGDSNP